MTHDKIARLIKIATPIPKEAILPGGPTLMTNTLDNRSARSPVGHPPDASDHAGTGPGSVEGVDGYRQVAGLGAADNPAEESHDEVAPENRVAELGGLPVTGCDDLLSVLRPGG